MITTINIILIGILATSFMATLSEKDRDSKLNMLVVFVSTLLAILVIQIIVI